MLITKRNEIGMFGMFNMCIAAARLPGPSDVTNPAARFLGPSDVSIAAEHFPRSELGHSRTGTNMYVFNGKDKFIDYTMLVFLP